MNPSEINILVGCEESQTVTVALRKRGFNAFSCDIQDCSGGHPEWHLKMDIFEAIELKEWHLGIFFPPCTFIANAGQANKGRSPDHWEEREKKTTEAIKFARSLYDCKIPRTSIENPIGVMSTRWRKPNQAIQPFYFGDPFRKYTCLWLKNLPNLIWNELSIVEPGKHVIESVRKGKYRTGKIRRHYWQDLLPKKDRAKIKSKTFPGIADAMAQQWGDYLIEQLTLKQAI